MIKLRQDRMCSRYFTKDEKTGLIRDVRPQDEAEALIAGEDGSVCRTLLRWGFLIYQVKLLFKNGKIAF